jgi:hypothetical protein
MASDTRGEVIIIATSTFEGWMLSVDAEISCIIPLMVSADLPDIDYYGLFEAGVEPAQAALEAVYEAGFDMD